MLYAIICLVMYVIILASIYLWERQLTVGDFLIFAVLTAIPGLNIICTVFAAGATFSYLVGTEGIGRFLNKRVL